MDLSICYSKNSSMVSRKIEDQLILVPIERDVGNLQSIYTMNDVGARIWELLDGKRTLSDIVSSIAVEFGVDQPQVEADIIDFVADLESVNAVAAS
jgi:hypothetical protein